jgi:hypothetical protein
MKIDGFEQDRRVVVIAATNRKEDLDPALIRYSLIIHLLFLLAAQLIFQMCACFCFLLSFSFCSYYKSLLNFHMESLYMFPCKNSFPREAYDIILCMGF